MALETPEDTIPWRERISLRASGRYFLGTAGALTLILGLIVAWREGAATAMLVVGGGLLLVALVGPGVKELRARHGETEIHILREFEQAIIETAAAPNEQELRLRLETLEKQVGEAAAALRHGSEIREALIRQLSGGEASPSRRSAEPIARTIVGPTYAKLTLSRAAFGFVTRIVCEVTTPSGSTYEAPATREGSTLVASNAHAIFPDDFAGATSLEPGPYRVEWKRASGIAGFAPPETLAIDDFVVLPPRPPSR